MGIYKPPTECQLDLILNLNLKSFKESPGRLGIGSRALLYFLLLARIGLLQCLSMFPIDRTPQGSRL